MRGSGWFPDLITPGRHISAADLTLPGREDVGFGVPSPRISVFLGVQSSFLAEIGELQGPGRLWAGARASTAEGIGVK